MMYAIFKLKFYVIYYLSKYNRYFVMTMVAFARYILSFFFQILKDFGVWSKQTQN